MNNVRKILLPVDFSPISETALHYVAGLVHKQDNISIKLLHVCLEDTSNEQIHQLEERLEQLSAPLRNHVPPINIEVRKGEVVRNILDTQEKEESDLIIMGTSGAAAEEIQTNTSNLVLQADCPVLVIPEKFSKFSISNIALALGPNIIDNSNGFQVLHDLARTFDAKVHVLTVNREGETVSFEDENEEVLEYYLDSLLYFHAFPQNSDIELGITNYVDQNDIDLLAIIPRNHAKQAKPSEGRLTKLLTLHTKVPLLTID
jgi:nucleotide-binding universal stress UspA family protein